MKVMRIVLCFCAISVLTMAAVSAQNGAVVVKGQDEIVLEVQWNGEDVVSVHSSNSLFYCDGDMGDYILYDWTYMLLPNGYEMYHDRAKLFTRVYWPATLDDVFDDPGDPCDFIENGPLVAEGIVNSQYSDNNVTGQYPRGNPFQLMYTGDLYDLAGLCGNGIVSLNILRKWLFDPKDYPACEPDCVKIRVWKGPRLNCE